MARRKSNAVEAVQSLEEATALLARYAVIETEIAEREAARDHQIAQINQGCEALNAPRYAELETLFRRIKPWFEANRKEIAGKRKSVKIAGVEIGHRIGNPTLKLPKGWKAADAIAWLKSKVAIGCSWAAAHIRTIEELDKEGMIRTIRQEKVGDMALLGVGFDVTQSERFFIEVDFAAQDEEVQS